MRNIQDETNLNQKKVLLRLDLNVPLDNGKITDTTRIDKILPTINFLLKRATKTFITAFDMSSSIVNLDRDQSQEHPSFLIVQELILLTLFSIPILFL